MTFTIRNDAQPGLLHLEGTFTFDGHATFRDVTAPLLEAGGFPDIVLDLSGVAYMDSAALGMLLLLREKAAVKGMKVVLSRPSLPVAGILKIVQFGKLFDIRES